MLTPKPLFVLALASALCGLVAGCSTQDQLRDANISVGGARPTQPPAPAALPDAPPHIVRVWLSSDAVGPLQTLIIQVTTSTNVASVEVRTENFSIDMPRTTFGQFFVREVTPDIAPIARRAYTLAIIARNTAGAEQIETLPFRLK